MNPDCLAIRRLGTCRRRGRGRLRCISAASSVPSPAAGSSGSASVAGAPSRAWHVEAGWARSLPDQPVVACGEAALAAAITPRVAFSGSISCSSSSSGSSRSQTAPSGGMVTDADAA